MGCIREALLRLTVRGYLIVAPFLFTTDESDRRRDVLTRGR